MHQTLTDSYRYTLLDATPGFPPPSTKSLHVVTLFGFRYPFINLLFADRLSIDSFHNLNRLTKKGVLSLECSSD